ncbi:MAG TPA: RNA methyltransferase [Leptolyngbyaceae cyanobacterium M65_K2018_010]|nr:RNA methyltransferase [Leptolyngbyaceae cyanobacterium M65_K2018_010]
MGLGQLDHIRIVLVEPAGALNVGATARIMKNMDLRHLVLVNPQCDPTSAPARQMAVHGQDVLSRATIVPTLPAALVGCRRAAATTGRWPPQPQRLEPPELVLSWLLPPTPEDQDGAALIFGPEDRGLSNEELLHAQRWIRIPASDHYPSLNLAQAVAVCSYGLYRLALERATPPSVPKPLPPAGTAPPPLEQLEGFYQDLEAVLLKIGYLYPHTAPSRMAKLRRMVQRAEPNQQELAMLRGILRQVNWAVGANQQPP